MNHDESTPVELARLADGTLSDAEAQALRARVEASPELRAELDEQRRAVQLTRATDEIVAPASLHASVHGLTSARSSAPRSGRLREARSWRLRIVSPLAAAAVAAAVVVVVLVSSGSSGSTLSVTRTAQVSLASATRGAPPVSGSDSELLSLHVGSVAFPAYDDHDDWRAVGARSDRVDARGVQTVFYDVRGRRVGYSIVEGAPLRVPRGREQTVAGVRYVTAPVGSAELVTWRRGGHTCVIAGRGVDGSMLVRLAVASNA